MPEHLLRRSIARARAISFDEGTAPRTDYRGLVELATAGITRTDTGSGRIYYANDAFCQMVGYTQDELSEGKLSFVELTHPEDRAKNISLHRLFMAGALPHYAVEKRYIRKNGTYLWARTIVTRMKSASGRVDETFAVILDITHEIVERDRQRRSVHSGLPSESPGTRSARRQMEEIERYILAHWDQPLTIRRLSKMAQLPRRTFFTNFRRLLGLSPKNYIKQLRLEKARQLLKTAGEQETVAAIAIKCGFGNLGHFARDYKQRYGERPSDTLRRGS